MRLFKPAYSSMTDEELMLSIGKGDKRAFDELYKRYAGLLLRYFKRMLWNDHEKAEDFVHDLFAKIIRNPAYFDPSRMFKTWVYSVANNMCKNEYKKQEIRKGNVQGLDHVQAVADQVNVLDQVGDQFFREKLTACLLEMDPKHREVFQLRHMDGLSIREIAEIINIHEGTVKSRLFYATKYLAAELKDFHPIETKS